MSRASRVTLAPSEPWDDDRLLGAARDLELPDAPLWPGDEVHGLVVERVEPQPGAQPAADTVLELLPHATRARGRGQHLVVLVDRGASMGAPWGQGLTRVEAARYALDVFLGQADALVDSVDVHTFARELRRVGGPAAPSTLRAPGAAEARPGGASKLSSALDHALADLAVQRTTRGAILVLTDSASDPEALQRTLERARRLGVPVHVAAFAPEDDAELVALARGTGGTFTLAAVPPTLAVVAAALADAAGVPRAWREPPFPRPGEPEHVKLTKKEERGPLSRLTLRQETKQP